jgi:hypothetical protein
MNEDKALALLDLCPGLAAGVLVVMITVGLLR